MLMLLAGMLLVACASRPPAVPPDVIHGGVHSGGSVVAFSESGELLASGGWEGTVRLWRMPAGNQQRHWRDHRDSVNGIAFFDDDSRLVTAGYDGRLVRRSVRGELLAEADAGSPVTHMAADVASDRLLTGHADGMVRLWRASDFVLLQQFSLHNGAVKAVAMDRGATRFATAGNDGRVLVRGVGGESVLELQPPPVDAWTLAFSPDGRWLSGGGWFRLFRWNLEDASLQVLPTWHHGIIKSVEYVSDGVLATISRQTDSSVYFLDPASGKTLRSFQRHDLCGGDVSVSGDGRYLATTSDDASVRIWRLQPEE